MSSLGKTKKNKNNFSVEKWNHCEFLRDDYFQKSIGTKFCPNALQHKSKVNLIGVRDFDNLILEHFIIEGLGEAAECFCKEAGLPMPTDMHEIKGRFQIRKAIESGDICTATSLLNDLNPRVLPPLNILVVTGH